MTEGVFINLWLSDEWREPMHQLIESVSTPYQNPEDVAYDALVHLMHRRLVDIEAVDETTTREEWWAAVRGTQQKALDDGQ